MYMTPQNVEAFVNFQYVPFSKKQCVKRLVFLWLLSAPICFINGFSVLWTAALFVGDAAVSVVFITLIAKLSHSKTARFLCDGLFFLYFGLLSNFAAYRVWAWKVGENPLLFALFLLLFLACIAVFVFVVFRNIKSGKYGSAAGGKSIGLFALVGGAGGIALARILLQGRSQEAIGIFLAILLLIFSLLISAGSVNLLKIPMSKKPENTPPQH